MADEGCEIGERMSEEWRASEGGSKRKLELKKSMRRHRKLSAEVNGEIYLFYPLS